MEIVVAIVIFAIIVLVYFLPALLAGKQHPHRMALFLINLFFGWTLVVWVGCLAWALIQGRETQTARGN